MKPLLAIPLLCLVASCGSGEAASLVLDAPIPIDGRLVMVSYAIPGTDVIGSHQGRIKDWDREWVTLEGGDESIFHLPTSGVYSIEELPDIYR